MPIETGISEQERWLRDSQRAGGVGSYHFDLRTGVWKTTPTMEEILGLPPGYPKTLRSWTDVVAPDQRVSMAAYFRRLIETGDSFDREYRIVRICDGQERWVHGRGEFIRDDSGALVSHIGTIIDITERKRTEEALRKSEEALQSQERILRALIDANPESLFLMRLDGTLIEANRTFAERVGKPLTDLLGRNIRDIQPRELVEPREEKVRKAISAGKPATFEDRIDGRDRDNRFFPAFGPSGEIDMVAGISIDITDKVQMQEQLTRNQKLESLGVLAGGIAHDFNNILTVVLGNLSFARQLVGTEHRAAGRLAECEKAAIRAGDLTRQLLTFAKGGAPIKGRVDTGALLDEVLQFALRGSNAKGALGLASDLWWLDADEGQVGQLLNNLLINAKQAMPGGGTVTVRAVNEVVAGGPKCTIPAGRYVAISVRDEGVGILPENITRIFDPYFTTKEGGSGLGLASVHSIVRRHGGDVAVSSVPGKGTEFIVRIPAAAENETPDGVRPTEDLEALPTGNGRVLVMDDDEMLAQLTTMMLEELGYTPEACPDGAEAIERYRLAREKGDPFSAVILDLTVPGGMGGKEAAARILELDPRAVLIVSSGYSNDPVMADCRAYGFKGAIAKPYVMGTLAAAMARLTPRAT